MKVIGILIIAIILNGCGRLDTHMPEESEKSYTISRYHNGVYVGGWNSKTKVYLKFEDKFIEVVGDFTIKENKKNVIMENKKRIRNNFKRYR